MTESKIVELRPLAVIDLSVSYARKMGGNKIRHYRISTGLLLSKNYTGKEAVQVVEDYIRKEEGNDVNVVVLPPLIPYKPNDSSSPFVVEDVTDKVLKNLPKLRKQLLRKKISASLHQYNYVLTPSDYNLDRSYTDRQGVLHKNELKMGLGGFLAYLASRIGLSRFVPNKYMVRKVTPVSYLSYSYEEPDEENAIETLRNDLKKLSDRGLIQGHLSTPFTMYLADTIGSGNARKVIACFVFVDLSKLYKQFGVTDYLEGHTKYGDLPLKSILAIESQELEGGIGPDLTKAVYDIEEINIMPCSDENRKAVIENYEATRDFVNQQAKGASNLLKSIEKVESGTTTIGQQVHVNVNLSKRDN